MYNKFYNAILFLILIATICGFIVFFSIPSYADIAGYINGDGVNFRETPNGTLIATYNDGQEITILGYNEEWAECIIDGVTGYVYSAFTRVDVESLSEAEPTPEQTIETTTEPEIEPTPVPTIEPTTTPIIVYVTPEPTTTPEPTPEPTTDPQILSYQAEQLTVLGSIEAILIFFTVVILCYFSYKFLRIFF